MFSPTPAPGQDGLAVRGLDSQLKASGFQPRGPFPHHNAFVVVLLQDIQDLLESWAELLTEASAIFLRAPSYNKTTFFGGRDAPLDKKDPRIRTLPFVTRRATFREVQRVHSLLSTVQTFGKEESEST